MKLNLLPKIVDTAARSKVAFFLGTLLLPILAGLGAFAMAKISSDRVALNKERLEAAKPQYNEAVKIAKEADDLMAINELKHLVTNTALSVAMHDSSTKYPDLYQKVFKYVPGFYRLTSISAVPNGATGCTVTMTGTIKNVQQYSDLVLSLLRIPGAINVSRAGYSGPSWIVPNITERNPVPTPYPDDKGPVPLDKYDRIAYFEANRGPTGYLSSGGFGDLSENLTKEVRPGESLVTMTVVLPDNIQTPDPRATLMTLVNTNQPYVTASATSNKPPGAPPGSPPGAPPGAPPGQVPPPNSGQGPPPSRDDRDN